MYDCHGPGKEGSVGPVQVVFFQQDCAQVRVKREIKINRFSPYIMDCECIADYSIKLLLQHWRSSYLHASLLGLDNIKIIIAKWNSRAQKRNDDCSVCSSPK